MTDEVVETPAVEAPIEAPVEAQVETPVIETPVAPAPETPVEADPVMEEKKDLQNDWHTLLEHIVAKFEGDLEKAWIWAKTEI